MTKTAHKRRKARKRSASSTSENKVARGEMQIAEDHISKHKAKEAVNNFYPKNDRQSSAIKSFNTNQATFLTGPAGCGKTELACWFASKLWLNGIVDNIVIARSNKTLGNDGGAVKGGDTEKLLNFVMSMLDKFRKYLGHNVLENNLKLDEKQALFDGKRGIQVVPVEKIQGRSFDSKTIVLLDEGQNADVSQMIACCTRNEEGCKLIVMGDVTQSAIGSRNGLSFMLSFLESHPSDDVGVIEFLPEDCQRTGFAAHVTKSVGQHYKSWAEAK